MREDAVDSIPGTLPFAALRILLSSSNLGQGHPPLVILGPSSSDTLVRIFKERGAKSPRNATHRSKSDAAHPALHLLDFGATAAWDDGDGDWVTWKESLPDCAVGTNTDCFQRFGASDDKLAETLASELIRRGMDERRFHIVLLSEWDSAYGQTLHDQIKYKLLPDTLKGGVAPEISDYFYFRGLDGRLPDDTPSARTISDPSPTSANLSSALKDANKPASLADADSIAEGESQIDYLRRLGDRIKVEADDSSIDAIGIVGSDVYDKLLIIQELRPLFPHTILFTTDLDARLLAHDVQSSTRNLVVASSFRLVLPGGAELKNVLTPPFRDNYETATFLTALYAAECDVVQPHVSRRCKDIQASTDGQSVTISEIGRSGKIESLDGLSPAVSGAVMRRLFSPAFWIEFFGSLGAISCIALVSAATADPDLPRFLVRGGKVFASRRTMLRWSGAAIGVTFTTLLLGPLLQPWLNQFGDGQAIGWADGTSLWPSIALQFADTALAVWFIVLIVLVLNANTVDLAERFKLDTASQVWGQLHRRRMSWEDFRLRRPALPYLTDQKTLNIQQYWREAYLFRCAVISRFARSALLSVIVLIPVGYAIWAFPADPLVARGSLVRAAYRLSTILCSFSLTLLASLVFDATMNSERFVKYIRGAPSHWPTEAITKYVNKLGFKEPCAADWIDMQFTRMRTRVILRLIYFPFLVLAIFMLAHGIADRTLRSNLFAVVLVAIVVLMLVACVIALRMEAEGQRCAMVKRLHEAISRAIGPAPVIASGPNQHNATREQLELLIERARSLRDGAFSPVLQQPMLKAVVLPVLAYCVPLLTGGLPG